MTLGLHTRTKVCSAKLRHLTNNNNNNKKKTFNLGGFLIKENVLMSK